MLEILKIIAPQFIIIFGAAIIQKIKNLDNSWEHVLNSFALNVGLPVLLFSVFAKNPISFYDNRYLIIFNSLFLIFCFFISFILCKICGINKKLSRTIFICGSLGNVAYLGIPILTRVMGNEILPTASLIVAIYLFWIFAIGTTVLDMDLQKNNKHVIKNTIINLVKNPLLIAVVFGVLLSSLHVSLPTFVISSFDMISASVTPLVLIIIGIFIGKTKINEIKDLLQFISFSVFKLLVLPAIFYFILKFQVNLDFNLSTSIIAASMPLAITPFALADKFDLDKKFIAGSIVISTILSLFTIPFWISILI